MKPKLYQDTELPVGKTLYDLSEAIVRAFSFDLDHAFCFYSKPTGFHSEAPVQYKPFADMDGNLRRGVRRTEVAKAFPKVGTIMLFLPNHRGQWRFKVEVAGVVANT